MSQNAIAVLDMDECLVNISPKWMKKCYDNGVYDKQVPYDTVLERKHYSLEKAFAMNDEKKFLSLYFDDDSFYDDLLPTPLLKGLVFTGHLNERALSKVIIVSKTDNELSAPVNISKKIFFKKHIENNLKALNVETELVLVPANGSKRDYIEKVTDRMDLLVDDSLSNIIDIITKCPTRGVPKVFPKVVMVPALGYVKDTYALEQIRLLLQVNGSSLLTYSRFS